MSKNSNAMKRSLVDSGDFVQDNSPGNISVSSGKASFSAALEEFKRTPEWERMLDSWLAEAMMTGNSLDATPFRFAYEICVGEGITSRKDFSSGI